MSQIHKKLTKTPEIMTTAIDYFDFEISSRKDAIFIFLFCVLGWVVEQVLHVHISYSQLF